MEGTPQSDAPVNAFDIKSVLSPITGWSFGMGVIGILNSLKTGRPFMVSGVTYFGYGFVLSSAFFVSRELLFGNDIRLYKYVDRVKKNRVETYPVMYTAVSGGIAGALAGLITSGNIARCLTGAIIFAAGTSAFHLAGNSVRYYIPELMNHKSNVGHKNSPRENEFSWRKYIPSWSPIQIYSKEENEQRKKATIDAIALEQEVEELRYKVETLRRVKELYAKKQQEES